MKGDFGGGVGGRGVLGGDYVGGWCWVGFLRGGVFACGERKGWTGGKVGIYSRMEAEERQERGNTGLCGIDVVMNGWI